MYDGETRKFVRTYRGEMAATISDRLGNSKLMRLFLTSHYAALAFF